MKSKMLNMISPCSGEVIPLEKVNDEVFSSGILGRGFAIVPSEKDFFSPCSGIVSNAYDTGHAYMINTDEGLDVLVHIGINTVELDGEYFSPIVKTNMKVSKGDKISYADVENIKLRGYDPVTVVVITNPERLDYFNVSYGKIKAGDTAFEYTLI